MTENEILEAARLNYQDSCRDFYRDLENEGFTERELQAMPSVFVPAWGEDYAKSLIKIVIAGKETYKWTSNLHKEMLNFKKDDYDIVSTSLEAFRSDGPAKWGTENKSKFWQYAAMALGRLCINPKDKNDVLNKDSPILRQIGWFNGHAIETAESKGIDHDNISRDKIDRLQILADMYELSSFKKMVSVLKPDIVIYFYRDSENRYSRFFDHDEIEFVRNWEFYDDKSAVREYQLGKTIILNMRHTNWMTHGNMKENECAESIYQVLSQIFFNKNLPPFILEKNHNYSVDNISIRTWLSFVEIIRTEAESKIQNMKNSSQDYQDNQTLARHLIAFLARELYKTQSTMTAQCLILLLNEVIHFRLTGWQYSPERRGPCSVVRTAWNYFDKRGRSLDAKYIADAYTKINGDYAYI